MRYFLGILVAYALIVVLAAVFQEKLMFHPDRTPFENCPEVFEDGGVAHHFPETRVRYYEIPSLAAPAGWVIYYPGNGGRVCDRYAFLSRFRSMGYHLALVEYPGYSESREMPSEAELLQTSLLVADQIAARLAHGQALVVYGESLGTTVATFVASKRPEAVAALILQAAFPSVIKVAQRQYFFLPVRWIGRFDFPAEKWAEKVEAPVFAYHGTRDLIIPFSFGEDQFKNFSHPSSRFLEVRGAGHNNVAQRAGENLWQELKGFLQQAVQE